MANELQTKLDMILADKNSNLKPEHLKKGVSLLGVKGELAEEYIPYKTMDELNAQEDNPNINEGQKALVYGINGIDNIEIGTIISAIKSVKRNFTLDTAITSSYGVGIYDYENDNNLYIELNQTYCLFRCGSPYSSNGQHYIGYWTSEDGMNYVGQDEYTYNDWMTGSGTVALTYGETVFSTLVYNEDDKTDTNAFLFDLIHELITFGEIKFNGLYEYTLNEYMNDRTNYIQNAVLVRESETSSYYNMVSDTVWVDLTKLYYDINSIVMEICGIENITESIYRVPMIITEMDGHRVTKCKYICSNKLSNAGTSFYFKNDIDYMLCTQHYSSDDTTYSVYDIDIVNKTYSKLNSGTFSEHTGYERWGDQRNLLCYPSDITNEKFISLYIGNMNGSSMGGDPSVFTSYDYVYYVDTSKRINTPSTGVYINKFMPLTTQFTLDSTDNIIGKYTVLGKSGELTSKNTWPKALNIPEWQILVNGLPTNRNFNMYYNYSFVDTSPNTMNANYFLGSIKYMTHEALIDEYLNNKQENTQYGYYYNNDELMNLIIEDDVIKSIGNNRNSIYKNVIIDDETNHAYVIIVSYYQKLIAHIDVNIDTGEYVVKSDKFTSDNSYYDVTGFNDGTYCGGILYNSSYKEMYLMAANIKTGDLYTIPITAPISFNHVINLKISFSGTPSLSTLNGDIIYKVYDSNTSKYSYSVYHYINGNATKSYTTAEYYQLYNYTTLPDYILSRVKNTSSDTEHYEILYPTQYTNVTILGVTYTRCEDGIYRYCYQDTVDGPYYYISNGEKKEKPAIDIDGETFSVDGVKYYREDVNIDIREPNAEPYSGYIRRFEDDVMVAKAIPIAYHALVTSNPYEYVSEKTTAFDWDSDYDQSISDWVYTPQLKITQYRYRAMKGKPYTWGDDMDILMLVQADQHFGNMWNITPDNFDKVLDDYYTDVPSKPQIYELEKKGTVTLAELNSYEMGYHDTEIEGGNIDLYGNAIKSGGANNAYDIILEGESAAMTDISLSELDEFTVDYVAAWHSTENNGYPFAHGNFGNGFGISFQDFNSSVLRFFHAGNEAIIDNWELEKKTVYTFVKTSGSRDISLYINGEYFATLEPLWIDYTPLHITFNNEENYSINPINQTLHACRVLTTALSAEEIQTRATSYINPNANIPSDPDVDEPRQE